MHFSNNSYLLSGSLIRKWSRNEKRNCTRLAGRKTVENKVCKKNYYYFVGCNGRTYCIFEVSCSNYTEHILVRFDLRKRAKLSLVENVLDGGTLNGILRVVGCIIIILFGLKIRLECNLIMKVSEI